MDDPEAVLSLFDRQLRQEAPADTPGARVERVGEVVRHVGTSDDWNGVLWSALDETTADAAIDAQIQYFTDRGSTFEWKLYAHDRPVDLGDRLRAAGFTPEPQETLMVAEIRHLPTTVALPHGVRLHTVTAPPDVELLLSVHQAAFGTSSGPSRQRLLAQLAAPAERFHMVIAMVDDVPVSAARMEMYPGTDFASLWGGGTIAAWRGRGVYRALVAHRARIAAEQGRRYLQVDASDDSRPILQRLGFVPLSTTTPYVRQS